LTALAAPPLGSILYGKEIPPFSGDTQFLNMYLAYETLSAPLRNFLDGLTCIHDQDVEAYGEARFKAMRNMQGASASRALHPLVRTHPETKRKALFLSRPARTTIKDLTGKESATLLAFLDEHASNPDFACRFRWRPHSVAFWDNRCTRHRVTADYFYGQRGFAPHRRHMYRVTVQGDVPS
jgi:taurine dioxygenase